MKQLTIAAMAYIYTIVILATTFKYVSGASTRQVCERSEFSCEYNDPCSPLCTEGQYSYPGRTANKWITCEGVGRTECIENRCPTKTYWIQRTLRCEDANGIEARCASERFDCGMHNPCSPGLCEADVTSYPGPSANKYITCHEGGGCFENQCLRRYIWDQDTQVCVLKTEN